MKMKLKHVVTVHVAWPAGIGKWHAALNTEHPDTERRPNSGPRARAQVTMRAWPVARSIFDAPS